MTGKHHARAQSAIEFMATYGWALAIILLTVATIYYFGFLDAERFQPTSCTIDGLSCDYYAASTCDGNMLVIFSGINNLGASIVFPLNGVSLATENFGEQGRATYAGTCSPSVVEPGRTYTCVVPITGTEAIPRTGAIVRADANITYTNQASGGEHTVFARIVSKAEGACVAEDYLCGNGACDDNLGEDYENCPEDCKCGNGVCDPGESYFNCPEDCPLELRSLSINVFPSSIPADDGSSSSEVFAYAFDQYGNPMPGIVITLDSSDGSISGLDVVTDSNGRATAILVSPTEPQEIMVTAVSGSFSSLARLWAVPTYTMLFCGELTQSTTLSSDINFTGEGCCFTISSPEIFLYGNGHTVNGTGVNKGVCVLDEEARVANLNLENFHTGVYLEGYTNNNISQVNVSSSVYGFYLNSTNYNELWDNNATENEFGLFLDSSEGNLVKGNEFCYSTVTDVVCSSSTTASGSALNFYDTNTTCTAPLERVAACGEAPPPTPTPTATGSPEPTPTPECPAQLTDDSDYENEFQFYGDTVTWYGDDGQVYLYDYAAGTEIQVTSGSGWSDYPDVQGNRVVYSSDAAGSPDIYVYDISTGVTTRLTSTSYDDSNPRVWGDKVVFNRDSSNLDVYLYDISSSTETQITSDPTAQTNPDIYGQRIVYTSIQTGTKQVYLYDLATSTETQLTTSQYNKNNPRIYGDIVVYYGIPQGNTKHEVSMYNIASGTETQVTFDDTANQWSADVFGDTIVWEDWRDPDGAIYAYSISSGAETKLTGDSAVYPSYPVIDGNRIVFQDERTGETELYMLDIGFCPMASPTPVITPTPTTEPTATPTPGPVIIQACDPTKPVEEGGSLITEEGNYALDFDLVSDEIVEDLDSCILVADSERPFGSVNINCQGHSIIGLNEETLTGYGIKVNDNFTRVILCNITGFEKGIWAGPASSNSTFSENTVLSNYHGFYLEDSGNILINNNASENAYGFYLYESSENILDFCYAGSNSISGFHLELHSNSNNMRRNTASGNHVGASLHQSGFNDIETNTFDYNDNTGFSLSGSLENKVIGNSASNNGHYGFMLESGSNQNTFTGNNALSNGDAGGPQTDDAGFYIMSNSNSNVFNLNLANLNDYGFFVRSNSIMNSFTSNNANSNFKFGFSFSEGSNTLSVIGNSAGSNVKSGFYASEVNLRLEGNTANSNGEHGVHLDGIDLGNFDSNTADANTGYGFYIAPFSNNNDFDDNSASDNLYGFCINQSTGNEFDGQTANSNDCGFYIFYSEDNEFNFNSADSNEYQGFCINSSSDNVLGSNSADSNSVAGFYLDSSELNILNGNSADSNLDSGFYLDTSNKNSLGGNSADSNSVAGFYLKNSQYNNMSGSTVTLNSQGFALSGSTNNIINLSIANSNTGAGIKLSASSSDNRLEHNQASLNDYGFSLSSSGNNDIYNNTACGNNVKDIDCDSAQTSDADNTCDSISCTGVGCSESCTSTIIGLCDPTLSVSEGGSRITEPGSYALASSLTDSLGNGCIYVESGATGAVIDCASNTITGSGAGAGDGIYLDGVSSVTVKDCEITGFSNGVRGNSASRNLITNNIASYNDYGFRLSASSQNNILTGNTASLNSVDGFSITSSSGSSLYGNTACMNLGHDFYCSSSPLGTSSSSTCNINSCPGLSCSSSCSAITVQDCDPSTSAAFGGSLIDYPGDYIVSSSLSQDSGNCIVVNSGADGSTLDCQGNTITGPGDSYGVLLASLSDFEVSNCQVTGFTKGFRLQSSTGVTLTGNTANSNTYGFDLYSSDSNTLTGNTANSNANFGFYLEDSDSNGLTGNTADSNSRGFNLNIGSTGNTLTTNNAAFNTQYGFHVYNAPSVTGPGNTLQENTADSNDLNGFRVEASTNTILTSNTALNSPYGFYFESASSSVIQQNTASENDEGFYFTLGGSGNTLANNEACGNTNRDVYCDSSQASGDNTCNVLSCASATCNTPCSFAITACDPGTPVSEGGSRIVAPGLYTLDGPLSTSAIGDCITITAGADGAVLDCQGNSVTGSGGTSGAGILMYNVNGVTVQGCTVSNFGYGMYVTNTAPSNMITGNLICYNIVEDIYCDSLQSGADDNACTNPACGGVGCATPCPP